ncbi:MAG TPA: pitrilysin family protein, partial [Gammaproteobacteria bacterium]|nr:pitrilysin family protein [Gammaproteobacteria bacterium]
ANGLKVIVIPTPSEGLVSYRTVVRTGARDEYEKGATGFAHFFEHMMFRGTERFPSDVYNRIITTIGADANAYTTDDHTAYHLAMAAEDLEQVMQIESDRFQNLSYAEGAFQTEAGAVYGEYRKSRTEPEFALYEELVGKAFERHPYGHTTLGYERDIAIMPTLFDYSREFFSRYYRPENTVLFIAGDVEPNAVFTLVEKYYGGWQRGYVPPQIPTEPEQTEERHVDVTYDGQTLPILMVAYKLPAYDAADRTRVAADLFADLAFGETSEAYRRLVLDEQVVEDIDAGASYNRDPGLLEISAHVKDPEKVEYVLGVIDETIDTFRAEPPDAARLADLQKRLRYGFLMGLQTPDDVASHVAQFIALSGDLEGLDQLYATFAAITPDDVQLAAERYLAPERRTVGVLRPKP